MSNILQNNIEALRIVMEESPMPVALYAGPDFQIVLINAAMQEAWGKEEPLLGKNLLEVIPELNNQPINHLLKYVYNTGTSYQATEDRIQILKKGRLQSFYFTLSFKPVLDDQNKVWGILHTATDVTQLVLEKQRESEINKAIFLSKERFNDMVQQAPVAIGILHGYDMRIEVANDEVLKLWGKSRNIIGLPLLEGLPEIKDQEFIHLLRKTYTTGEPIYGFEKLAYLERNGQIEECYFNFIYSPFKEADGKVNGVIITGSEVTQQVLSKKKLEASEKRFRNLIIEAPMATALYKGREMRIEIANEAMLNLWGKDESVIGKELKHALPELEGQPFLDLLDQVFLSGKAYHTEQQRAELVKDGKLQSFWFNFTYKPLLDDKGEVYAILNMAVDISTQVHLQKQKDEFLGIASHELKTPVTVLKAYVQLLEETMGSKEGVNTDIVNKMDKQVNRLNHLIGDLLDVTKINSGKLDFNYTTYDFDELVTEVAEEIQHTAVKHKIEQELQEVGPIYGDKERTGQVIVNLLTNAIKYSPGASKILLKTKKKGNEVQVSIRDFGIGISKDQQERIFEQFYRAEGKKNSISSGLGLGLFISSEFIRREGGRIWVDSEEGKGSTFYFTLPIRRPN